MSREPVPGLRRLRFDASPCHFPRAAVPMLAPVDRRQLSLLRRDGVTLSTTRTQVFLRGRYGLHEAFRRAGLGPGKRLLVPSYHCPTMADPGLRLGADIVLYPLKADLTVDVQALQRLLQAEPQSGDCLLLTHFFGIAQPDAIIEELQALCAAHQLRLIEDCSHCLALGPSSLPEGIGSHGDFAVSSPYKFIPVPEMGLLWTNHGGSLDASDTPPATGRQGWRQAATLMRGWAAQPGQAPAWKAPNTKSATSAAPAREWEEDCVGISSHYLPSEEGRHHLPISNFILERTPLKLVTERRRENFQRWLSLCKGLPQLQPLHATLPDACVPYMFPVLLDAPEMHFAVLKHAGLPIWRWDDELASPCNTASRYRLGLLHLPCQQGLSESQWQWMERTLHACLNGAGLSHAGAVA
ncbi:MAG: DegT/DnrJ/EryC1/StrS family aminotransferase [Paucibacter sp.]|nr:DegT/DnrJ/EryC1/StrS family aminotransferase [Roseateles sp.]